MQKAALTLRDREVSFRHVTLLLVLYSIPPALAMLPIIEPDIWWRFRTGQWIAEHNSAPVIDVFSAFSMGKPSIEYSWLFELIVYTVHAQFGLSGLVYLVLTMAFLITFAAHQLVRGLPVPFAAEIALVALAVTAMKSLMTPRPWLFTILFVLVELLVIDRVRRSGKTGLLWTLPLLFAVWANLHIQFVYGLAVLGLLFAESVLVITFGWFGHKIDAPTLVPRKCGTILMKLCGGQPADALPLSAVQADL